MIDRADVLALFSSQFWVADIAQLKEAGVSAAHHHESAATRDDRRRAPRHRPPRRQRGDVRVQGDGAAAARRTDGRSSSGVTAGALHGLRQMPRSIVEITVPEDRRSVMPAWGRLVRTSWIDADATSQTRDDGLRVATPAADAVPPGPDVQRPPLRAGRRGLLAPRPRHAGRRRRLPGRRPAQGKCRRDPVRALAGEDGRTRPDRARAASSSTSSTPSAVPACPSPSGSTR